MYHSCHYTSDFFTSKIMKCPVRLKTEKTGISTKVLEDLSITGYNSLIWESKGKVGVHILNSLSCPKILKWFSYGQRACFSSQESIMPSTILSALDYGNKLFAYAATITLKRLDAVYHSAIRFTIQDSYRTHHCELYEKVGWSSAYLCLHLTGLAAADIFNILSLTWSQWGFLNKYSLNN